MITCLKNDYGELKADMEIGPACWPHFDLMVVHGGGLRLKLASKRPALSRGDALLIYPETPFRGAATVDGTLISVHHFHLEPHPGLPPAFDALRGKRQGFALYKPHDLRRLNQDVEDIVGLSHDDAAPGKEEIRTLLMALILARLNRDTRHARAHSTASPEITALTEWMKEHLAEAISLDRMAGQIHLSASHFRALFKQQIGTSPGRFLIDLRSREAARLLRSTAVPIKEIADSTGYKDLTHFYHAFRQVYNTTPKAYRNRHRVRG